MGEESLDEFTVNGDSSGATVLEFDYNVENHFKAMDTVCKLSMEEDDGETLDARFSSKVTFLRNRDLPKKNKEPAEMGEESLDEFTVNEDNSGATVLEFDYNVENHFKAMDTVCKLSMEEDDGETLDARFSSKVTFLREWKDFNYGPRIIKMTSELEGREDNDVIDGLNLPQFSAANIPKIESLPNDTSFLGTSKDFILYTGGPVWGLDWCPRVHQKSDHPIKCEYLAVAAHPPASSYNKIGALLIGRGVVQIWCLLHDDRKDEEELPRLKKPKGKPRGRPRKNGTKQALESSQPKKPRGRPRKDKKDNHFFTPLAVEFLGESSEQLIFPGTTDNMDDYPLPETSHKDVRLETETLGKCSYEVTQTGASSNKITPTGSTSNKVTLTGITNKMYGHSMPETIHENISSETETLGKYSNEMLTCRSGLVRGTKKRKAKDKLKAGTYIDGTSLLSSAKDSDEESYAKEVDKVFDQDAIASLQKLENGESSEITHLSDDVALPRIVLCLAHNGRVAWDVKWRPNNPDDQESKHHMGYLAVLLGNGSLEVWEVPSLSTIKVLYSSCKQDGTDPRFVKLEPVFRCSKLKCGDRQSIPLTMEWSLSMPHDLILAGCHDGTVAVWKFSASSSCQDTRPLLCFSADAVPIRALTWAPDESDLESRNVIVTAGHAGLRFWDLRDPYRPLWENPGRRVIYGLDWLPDPRCLLLSLDDGSLRFLSLPKAAYDVPVTGKPFDGTQQQGFHNYYCSSFPIWNVQASKLTGMVAYCSADGSVLRFQLTSKAVDKEPGRNQTPHYLCGSLTEEDDGLTVNTTFPNIRYPMKKAINECGEAPRSMRSFMSDANPVKKRKEKMPQSRDQKISDPEYPGQENVGGLHKGENIPPAEVEVPPPKIVAMHRVRWNVNKGSERWLCFGGAAGIVRCQKIVM